MERIESIKERLERNKKWKTQTENGLVPTVIGEYKHDDVEWLIKQTELLQEVIKELDEKIYSASCIDEHDVVFELESLKMFIKEKSTTS